MGRDWKTVPYVDIVAAKDGVSCPGDYEKIFSSVWPGTVYGCHVWNLFYEDVMTLEEYNWRYAGYDDDHRPTCWPVFASDPVKEF